MTMSCSQRLSAKFVGDLKKTAWRLFSVLTHMNRQKEQKSTGQKPKEYRIEKRNAVSNENSSFRLCYRTDT